MLKDIGGARSLFVVVAMLKVFAIPRGVISTGMDSARRDEEEVDRG